MKTMSLLCSLLAAGTMLAQTATLNISDPHASWSEMQKGTGMVDSATLVATPAGGYCNVEMTLVLSGKGLNITASDTVEITSDFNLPENSIFSAASLWCDGQVVNATLMDRTVATQIYEGIVKRKKDPLIVYKNSKTSYQFKIYPMIGNASRKVKFTIMVPSSTFDSVTSFSLPVSIITASRELPGYVSLTMKNTAGAKPSIKEFTSIAVESDKTDGYACNLSNQKIQTITLQYLRNTEGELDKNIYFDSYKKQDEGYYTVSFVPQELFRLKNYNKYLFLVDINDNEKNIANCTGGQWVNDTVWTNYDKREYWINSRYVDSCTFTSTKRKEVLDRIETFLKSKASEKDSFNIIVAGSSNIEQNGWIAANRQNIEHTISTINQSTNNYTSDYNTMFGLANKLTPDLFTSVFMISNNTKMTSYHNNNAYDLGNKMADSIVKTNKVTYPVHCFNLSGIGNRDYYYYNYYYYNSNYFLNYLSSTTKAGYYTIKNLDQIQSNSKYIIEQKTPNVKFLDVMVVNDPGQCYNQFSNSYGNVFFPVNKPVLTSGKFSGTGAFTVFARCEYDRKTYSKSFTFEQKANTPADTLLEKVWAGAYINTLEDQMKDNYGWDWWGYYHYTPQEEAIKQEILATSLEYGILSKYTSFLAIDPNIKVDTCFTCTNNTWRNNRRFPMDMMLVDSKENDNMNKTVASPTIFAGSTTISLVQYSGEAIITISDLAGRNVRQVVLDGDTSFVWDGTNSNGATVQPGVYYITVQYKNDIVTIKVVKTK